MLGDRKGRLSAGTFEKSRNRSRFWSGLGILVFGLSVSATTALAQTDQIATKPQTARTADLVITVTDPVGAVVPNSSISLKSISGDDLYEGKTDVSGIWNVNGIAIGTYKLRIIEFGFKPEDEEVRVASPATSITRTLTLCNRSCDVGTPGSYMVSDTTLQLYPSLVQIDPLPLIPQPIFRKRWVPSAPLFKPK